MSHNIAPSKPAAQIQRDNMKLTVANVRPSFKKKSEQEARQEIEARLYQIFKRYASYAPGGRQNV